MERLVQFVTQELNVEDQRHIAEQLSEEELAIFDLLTQPDITLSDEDKAEVKIVPPTICHPERSEGSRADL